MITTASDNIISGTSITLGGAITLAQSGFGRTGTVDWQTTAKTATFTAVNQENGYFAKYNRWSIYTMNLPAGSAGDIVSVVDYANTFGKQIILTVA